VYVRQTRRRDLPLEVVHQQLVKQTVVAVAGAGAIERHHKQIRLLQPRQQLDTVPWLPLFG
jgi:hypothetical protein